MPEVTEHSRYGGAPDPTLGHAQYSASTVPPPSQDKDNGVNFLVAIMLKTMLIFSLTTPFTVGICIHITRYV